MKKWLKATALAFAAVGVMVALGCCSTTAEATGKADRMILVDELGFSPSRYLRVYADSETGVEYLVVTNGDGMAVTIMENFDGTNKIWYGYEGWRLNHGY